MYEKEICIEVLDIVLDLDLEDVAIANVHKLQDRLERGVVVGEGDNR